MYSRYQFKLDLMEKDIDSGNHCRFLTNSLNLMNLNKNKNRAPLYLLHFNGKLIANNGSLFLHPWALKK